MNTIKQIIIALALVTGTATTVCMQQQEQQQLRRYNASSPFSAAEQEKIKKQAQAQSQAQDQKNERARAKFKESVRLLQEQTLQNQADLNERSPGAYAQLYGQLLQKIGAEALRETFIKRPTPTRAKSPQKEQDGLNATSDFRPIGRTPSPAITETQSTSNDSRSASRSSESTEAPSPATITSESSTSMSPELVQDYMPDIIAQLLQLSIKPSEIGDFNLIDDTYDDKHFDLNCIYSTSSVSDNQNLDLTLDVRTQGKTARHFFKLGTSIDGNRVITEVDNLDERS